MGSEDDSVPGQSEPLRGRVHVLFVHDVGLAVDLDQAAALLAEGRREGFRLKRKAPAYVGYEPAPLRLSQSGGGSEVAGLRTADSVECVVYDFGAVSVRYTIPFDANLEALERLGATLYDQEPLLSEARRRVESILEAIRPAVSRASLSSLVEDYVIYEFDTISGEVGPWLDTNAQRLARILRAETSALSQDEVDDALSVRLRYGEKDLVIPDWNAALIVDEDSSEDTLAVLEFANVELLEMRWLDAELDLLLERAHEALGFKESRLNLVRGADRRELRRLGLLQMDAATLFEGVNNALKLLGDHFLARVYRVTAERLHLPEWDAGILRKLETAENVYSKVSDYHTTRRLEILEWIIILLIALSIVLMLVP